MKWKYKKYKMIKYRRDAEQRSLIHSDHNHAYNKQDIKTNMQYLRPGWLYRGSTCQREITSLQDIGQVCSSKEMHYAGHS